MGDLPGGMFSHDIQCLIPDGRPTLHRSKPISLRPTPKVDEVFRDPNRPRPRDTAGLWEAVRRLQCPTLLINGAESDILAPDAAQRMVAAMPHGQLATVPGAGHSVMGDNPEGFYQAVKTFLDRLA